MTLPNFLVLGTAKAGTSTLASYLDQHPEVCFAQVPEPNFFVFDIQYAKGQSYYKSLFSHFSGEACRGEKSWRYACSASYPECFQRIRDMLPSLKLIYVVRDPLARGISMWRELRDSGQDIVSASPEGALLNDPLILDSMRYATTWRTWVDAYGEENMLLLFFEDLVASPEDFFNQVTDFLGIEQFKPEREIHENPSIGLRSDGRILEWLRKTGWDRTARAMLPGTLRVVARRVLKTPIGNVELSEQTREAFLEMVRPEATAILDIAGKPHTFWTLE